MKAALWLVLVAQRWKKDQIAYLQHFVKALKALSVFKHFCPALILSHGQLLDAALNVANNVQESPLSFLPQFSTGNDWDLYNSKQIISFISPAMECKTTLQAPICLANILPPGLQGSSSYIWFEYYALFEKNIWIHIQKAIRSLNQLETLGKLAHQVSNSGAPPHSWCWPKWTFPSLSGWMVMVACW